MLNELTLPAGSFRDGERRLLSTPSADDSRAAKLGRRRSERVVHTEKKGQRGFTPAHNATMLHFERCYIVDAV